MHVKIHPAKTRDSVLSDGSLSQLRWLALPLDGDNGDIGNYGKTVCYLKGVPLQWRRISAAITEASIGSTLTCLAAARIYQWMCPAPLCVR